VLTGQRPRAVTIFPMPNIGLPEILIVLVIALVVFGPKRLPELGRSLGKGISEFKNSVSGDHEDEEDREMRELHQSKAEAEAEVVESAEGEVVTDKRA
jgi:sec-independent protein translocase protein TatA